MKFGENNERLTFTVDFKSLWIRTLVLGQLDFLQNLDTAFMISEMAAMSFSAALAGFVYEPFAAKKLASCALGNLDLTKMVANEGTTTYRVPDKYHTITVNPHSTDEDRYHASSPLILLPASLVENISLNISGFRCPRTTHYSMRMLSRLMIPQRPLEVSMPSFGFSK
jgi:hypothetical protein